MKLSLFGPRRLTPTRLLFAALMVLLAAVYLAPFLVMLSTSFKTMQEAFDPSSSLLPRAPTLANYPAALAKIPFFSFMGNTATITLWCLAGQLLVTPMVAYSLAKIRWRGADLVFSLVLGTMMIPYTVTMIPLYKTWRALGLTGTYVPLIAPAFAGSAFYIVILTQFFKTVPDSLMEAAKIDGATEATTYARVALPLVKPALATVAIFTFLASWSDYLAPMIYISRAERFTLSLGLQAFLNQYTVDWTLLMAAAAVFVLPVVAVFLVLQKNFVDSIATSGLK